MHSDFIGIIIKNTVHASQNVLLTLSTGWEFTKLIVKVSFRRQIKLENLNGGWMSVIFNLV